MRFFFWLSAMTLVLSTSALSQTIEFNKLRGQMTRTYPRLFPDKLPLSFVGTSKDGARTMVYMRLDDKELEHWVIASCLPLNEGGWMCFVSKTSENVRDLPVAVK
jgi:hypothetical protein